MMERYIKQAKGVCLSGEGDRPEEPAVREVGRTRVYLLAAFLDRARSLGPNLLSGPIDQRRCMG